MFGLTSCGTGPHGRAAGTISCSRSAASRFASIRWRRSSSSLSASPASRPHSTGSDISGTLDARLRSRASHALFNVFVASMCVVACADNGATFLFAWELMALSSYLLVIGDSEQQDASTAGLWYAVMTHAGFLALLAAFILLGEGGSWEFPAIRNTAVTLGPDVTQHHLPPDGRCVRLEGRPRAAARLAAAGASCGA